MLNNCLFGDHTDAHQYYQVGAYLLHSIASKNCLIQNLFFRYNNKTYRIDDIAWDHTPNNTFKRGDTEISFKNYYKTVGTDQCALSGFPVLSSFVIFHPSFLKQYTLDITDGNQVLLISHVKRLGSAGPAPPGPAMLVPEFCYLTGQPGPFRSPPYSPHINVFLETVS